MSRNKIIATIRNSILHDNEDSLHKALMRHSGGSMSKAYAIIRASAEHYGLKGLVEDYHIEVALSELNGGCEVEWPRE